MVSVDKKVVNGGVYYRLVHSYREGGKVRHRTKYIGKKLPSKEKLQKLKKEFLAELSAHRFQYISKSDFEKIESKKNKHRSDQKKLTLAERKKQLEEFYIRFTYDSSKLSGVDVTLRQTALVLKDGLIPKDITNLKTVKELENHRKGIAVITKYRGRLDKKFLRKIHNTLFDGIDDEVAGKFRYELKRNVKIAGTPYLPTKWQTLEKELENFLKWYYSESKKMHPLELASLVHIKLISMQVFADGNSRLSRLMMNWILWKKNYPMIDIPIEDLEKYYNALDKYQIEKQEKPFVKYIIEKYLKME
jgi:Fic family protein